MGKSVYWARLAVGLSIACLALLLMQVFRQASLPRQGFYELFRYLAREDTRIRTHSFKIFETDHFVIKFLEEDEEYVTLVAKNAEAVFKPVTGFFNFRPRDKTVIIIYPDGESLAQSFGWDKDEQAMGVYWGGSIRILSPGQWLSDQSMEQAFTRDGPIVHEFTHLLVDYMTRGNYNRWFTEGVAQYMEKKTTGFAFGEPLIKDNVTFYDFTTLEADFDSLDQSLAYWQSLQAVELIVEKEGDKGLLGVIEALSKGDNMAQALEKGTGISFSAFSNELYTRMSHNQGLGGSFFGGAVDH